MRLTPDTSTSRKALVQIRAVQRPRPRLPKAWRQRCGWRRPRTRARTRLGLVSRLGLAAGEAVVNVGVDLGVPIFGVTEGFSGSRGSLRICLGRQLVRRPGRHRHLLSLSRPRHEESQLINEIAAKWRISTIAEAPTDPNALVGPAGFGTEGFIHTGRHLVVHHQFRERNGVRHPDRTSRSPSSSIRASTGRHSGSVRFWFLLAAPRVSIPAELTQYQTTVSYQNADGSPLNFPVEVRASISTSRPGCSPSTYTSLDPATGQTRRRASLTLASCRPTTFGKRGWRGVHHLLGPPGSARPPGQGKFPVTLQQAAIVFDTNEPFVRQPRP